MIPLETIVSILVGSDDTKTHLQPPLVSGTHSLPWHSATDDQYSEPLDMLSIVIEDCGGTHWVHTLSQFNLSVMMV